MYRIFLAEKQVYTDCYFKKIYLWYLLFSYLQQNERKLIPVEEKNRRIEHSLEYVYHSSNKELFQKL